MKQAPSLDIIEKRIGYFFRDRTLLLQAFTRSSYCNEKNYGGKDNYSSNEVLEFFGDSVLSTAIVTLLLRKNTTRYEHGIRTKLTEGDFSNIRSKLSDKRNLSKSLREMGLQKYMLLGEGDEKLGISEEPSVMEDLFESIIGAVYIDCGMNIETVISVVEKMLDVNEYTSAEAPIQSYKNALQEWCADKKHRLPAPVYKTVSESGPDHKKVYERGVYIGERLIAVGHGKNQKLADTAAAEAALNALKAEKSEQTHAQTAKEAYGSAQALRNLASERKLSSPEYHDLGEAPESTETRKVYLIECCFGEKSATAKGYSKQEARDLSSALVLKLIEKEEKPAKTQIPIAHPKKATAAKAKTTNNTAAADTKKKPLKDSADAPPQRNNKPLTQDKKREKIAPHPKMKPLHHTKRS